MTMMQKIEAPALVRAANLSQPDECKRIDAFVRDCAGSTPFHLTGWSRAVERACGQKAHYLIAEGADGEISGVVPLSEIRSILFGKALVSAGFAVDGGVLARDTTAALTLLEAGEAHARSICFPGLELRGGMLPAAGEGWHFDETTYLGFSRDLAGDDEKELLAIPRKQRAEVRKALGFELTIETGSSPRDLDAHFEVYATSVRNLGTPVFPRALFAAMIEELGNAADVLTIRQDGRAIASVLSLYWNGTVYPYWGGGTADARTWRANDLMYYALMCHARTAKSCTRFDFGRSKAGTGPAAFKKNWGFEGTPLRYAKLSLDGAPPRDVNPLSAKYRFQVVAWQKLPLWLANRLGPMLSRGLG
jgi:FemAB-related protein (PEP-CTERM system-associated)